MSESDSLSEVESPRTESDVIGGLSGEAKALLHRVLEIERSRLHLTAADATVTDEILTAVKGIVP